jgi:hypothetical protein
MFRAICLAAALGATPVVSGPAGAAEQRPCTIATKGDSPVARACADNGIDGAKAAMKDLVKKGRSNGAKYQCDGCHKDDQKYSLTPDARDKFKKLLDAVAG